MERCGRGRRGNERHGIPENRCKDDAGMGEGVRAYRCGYDLHRPGDMEIGKVQNRDRQSLLKEEPAVLVSVDRVFCHVGPTCEEHDMENVERPDMVGDIL